MPNIPGIPGFVQPDTFVRVRTIRRALSIPGGLRLTCIMGLGESEEDIILDAQGGGADGVNPDYAASNAPDGRHFVLQRTNYVPNRTTILLNGIPLTGVETTINSSPFNNKYDYRFEPATGRLELQRASLVDQGGAFFVPGSSNVGDGTLSTLELIDANAPSETWTLRATSVIRDAYGDPISGNAVFNVVGSVSGTLADAYGAPIVFISDGVTRDNGILSVAITEGSTPFERGDRFTIEVASRVLQEGDNLQARTINEADINDPELFLDATSLFQKHGQASLANTLSLGAQMAFENGAFGVLALQPRPVLPRRTSEVVQEANDPLTAGTEGLPPLTAPPAVSIDDIDIFQHPILSGVPDLDTAVNIFVTDGADGTTETQIFPNKVGFYNSTIEADPYNEFIDNPGFTFSYTVILDGEIEDSGDDGEVTSGASTFRADSAMFAAFRIDTGEADTLKRIRILNKDKFGADASAVAGVYTIGTVGDGTGDDTIVTLSGVVAGSGGTLPFAATATDLVWELVDPADESAKLLLTKDLQTNGTIGTGDGLRVSFIDQDDADFFDNNWGEAFETLEAADCQIVVPLPDCCFSAVQQAARQHVEFMSSISNKKERLLFTGAQTGVTADALVGRELVAVEDIGVLEGIQGDDADELLNNDIEDLQNFSIPDNFGTTFRVVYFFPDQIVRAIQGTRTFLPGYYMAAAGAGFLSGTANVAIPLTRKTLTGFSILRDRTYRQVTLNELGQSGVTVVVPATGGGTVLHGRTTTSSGSPEEEEISIVFIRDRIATVLRTVLRAFIGQPEDPTLAAAITSRVLGALNGLQGQNIITDFQNLNVTRDEVDPRQWNVVVEVQPNFPVNWIFVDVSIGVL